MLYIEEMTKIIKNSKITDSNFMLVKEQGIDIHVGNQLFPLSTYLQNLETLVGRSDYGIWIDSDEEIEVLAEKIYCDIIALNFPSFNDGRPYSSANLLRQRLKFQGEVRAVGDVRRDQLEQMVRCGFNAFEMAKDEDLEASLASLQGFTVNHQTTADRPEPLFRKR